MISSYLDLFIWRLFDAAQFATLSISSWHESLLDAGVMMYMSSAYYSGDMIGNGGGVKEVTRTRLRCAGGKLKEIEPLLMQRGASL
jgi:hypothetical protein